MTEKEALNQGLTIIKPKLPPQERVFKGLPLKKQVVCVLRLARFTYRQIVPLLGISEKTAKRWIKKSKEKFPLLKNL